VPWTCEWLFHFESWLFTGEWEGGGTTHEPIVSVHNSNVLSR
jgi:hypothetical protein